MVTSSGRRLGQDHDHSGSGDGGDELDPLVVTLQDAAADPTADGVIRRNGSDVKVQTGGNVKNLNDVGSGGGGGVSTKATATGQEGLYTFEAPTGGDHVFAGTDAAFAERRTQTFAADGVRGVEDRTSVGGGFTNTLGPNETDYVYMWQRDLSTVTGGTSAPGSSPRGMVWDGSRFLLTDIGADYIYELDSDLAVTGGRSSPGGRLFDVAWNGSRFAATDFDNDYIYELDSTLAVVDGRGSPGGQPRGITWDGKRYIHGDPTNSGYLYELNENFTVQGGMGLDLGFVDSLAWDGSRIIAPSFSAPYMYILSRQSAFGSVRNTGFKGFGIRTEGGVVPPGTGPTAIAWDGSRFVHGDGGGYLYEYSGSFDFTAGIIS